MSVQDLLDEMITEVAKRRVPTPPLYPVMAGVFSDFLDRMEDADFDALASTGYQAIRDAGSVPTTPEGQELFSSEAMDRLGDDYETNSLTEMEQVQLGVVGFMMLAAEDLMGSEVASLRGEGGGGSEEAEADQEAIVRPSYTPEQEAVREANEALLDAHKKGKSFLDALARLKHNGHVEHVDERHALLFSNLAGEIVEAMRALARR